MAEFVVDEDTFSKDSEPEADPVVKFKEASRIFYIGEIRHEFNSNDSIFMLASACLKSREVSERCRTCSKICIQKDQIVCEFCG